MKSPTAVHTLASPGRRRASYGFDRDDLHVRGPGRPAQTLRGAIDCMPLETCTAMRDALGANPIIVGAYTDRNGGVCPMLAAHRNGGRTSFAAFAHAWDRYTRAGEVPRRATRREVRALAAMLDASIAMRQSGNAPDLGAAIADHQASRRRPVPAHEGPRPPARSRRRRRETGERERTGELHRSHGWAWLRPFRRLDEYERALSELDDERPAAPRSARQRSAGPPDLTTATRPPG